MKISGFLVTGPKTQVDKKVISGLLFDFLDKKVDNDIRLYIIRTTVIHKVKVETTLTVQATFTNQKHAFTVNTC